MLNDEGDDDPPEVEAHREVMTETAVHLEYKLKSGEWVSASQMPAKSIRAYELQMLPTVGARQNSSDANSCSKDPQRAVEESSVGRKSGGLLIAVYPCLHIVGVRPMYSSESLTQVVMFVWHVLSYLRGVTFVVYDFACGVLRRLRAQMRK